MKDLSPVAQELIDFVGTVVEREDLDGSQVRSAIAVVFIAYCKATGASLDDAKKGIGIMWDSARLDTRTVGQS